MPNGAPPELRGDGRRFVLVGGSGFVGTALAGVLRAAGAEVLIVDRRRPPGRTSALGVSWVDCDLLVDEIVLPPGDVVVLVGNGNPRPRWLWTLPLEIALTTARLAPALADRRVTLVSSIEAYGSAPPPLSEHTEPVFPLEQAELSHWCEDAQAAARDRCPPWRAAPLCRRLVDFQPSPRWIYGLSKLAQERLVQNAVPEGSRTILRVANTFGLGQERVVSRFVRSALAGRALAATEDAVRSFVAVDDVATIVLAEPGPGVFNIGSEPVAIVELAALIRDICASSSPIVSLPPEPDGSCGVVDTTLLGHAGIHLPPLAESLGTFVERLARSPMPLFDPPLRVVVPPRPTRPDEVAERQQTALWSGRVKNGQEWTNALRHRLGLLLDLGSDDEILLTTSGTEALRLAVVAAAGPARDGEVAVAPSFTYPATVEVLLQLGYTVRFVDVDEWSWTVDATELERAFTEEQITVVVSVDTFGNPCDYATLVPICRHAEVPLVADSAAALGSLYRGVPVGTQADAHAFSMSFAKVISAGGAGGAVVVRGGDTQLDGAAGWLRSALMDELHAIAALDQLAVFDELVERRQRVAAVYNRVASGIGGVVSQRVATHDRHSYVHWVARVPHPMATARELAHAGVETKDYFRALHLQRWGEPRPVRLPRTERLDSGTIALPMSSELTDEEAEAVAVALEAALARAATVDEELLAEVRQTGLTRQPTLE
jgi:dTDP-4-amino-4,6-dideoxygalactose transaminase/nucleoside-diphosphate-sugar epimerase